jgi:small subunit ribosomal protein S4
MGDPKSQRRSYTKPEHPWQGDRIEEEDEYVRKYGLKNKKEFWKAESFLRDQRAQARNYLPLVLRDDEQGIKEADQLLDKLHRLGILESDANLDDVLALGVDAILSRRLQTVTYLKGLANTPTQARQFIAHGHIAIGDRKVTVPGKLVERSEEPDIRYAPGSPLNNPAHPLREGGDDLEIPGPPDTGSEDVEGPGAGPEDVDEAEDEKDDEEPEAEDADEGDEGADDEEGEA